MWNTDERTQLKLGDAAALILRLALGVIFFAHGSQKMLGWYDGPGWSGTMGFMTQMGIPALLAMGAIFIEFFGGLLLVIGLFTRLSALGIAVVMGVAIAMVHGKNGFFSSANGFEYNLALLAMALALVAYGAGRWSLDALFAASQRKKADDVPTNAPSLV